MRDHCKEINVRAYPINTKYGIPLKMGYLVIGKEL